VVPIVAAGRDGGADACEAKRAKSRARSGRAKFSRRRKARGASGPGRPGHRWPQREKNVFDGRFLPDTDRVVSPPPG